MNYSTCGETGHVCTDSIDRAHRKGKRVNGSKNVNTVTVGHTG
jgi:hypothetical protein